jgi:hypothetical protein
MIASVGRMMRKGGGGLSWPAGMKEHIKAWYDPKKQGMTNFDVIESYADDFTKWRIENTGVTSTQKKIVIAAGTELKYNVAYKGFGNSIAKFDIKYTGNAVIRYQYNKEDGTTGIITINRSGIYHLPASIKAQKNFGFYCNPQTVTEEATIEQLPTSILKDFSGNGNHAYLYGGKGKLNSGMGVYQQDFSNVRGVTTVSANGFELFREGTGGTYLARISIGYWNNKECRLLFETNNTSNLYYIRYRKANNDIVTSVRLHNGENIIPAQDDLADVSEVIFEGALRDNEYIRVTEIPDCPDQLCYDGKMYAVCYGFPILTDYTVMAERTWFERQNRACFLSKITTSGTGAFGFEFYNEYNEDTTYSFGRVNNVKQFKDGITYQITNSYNGIVKLDYIVNGKDNAELYIGKLRPSERPAFIGCRGTIIVADRSFTEEEINWLKDNLFRK